MRPSSPAAARAACLALAALALAAAPAAAVTPEQARASLDRYAPALVTIRAVVKTEMMMAGQGRDQESTLETLGVVVDPSGLILLSSLQISASRLSDIMEAMGGPGGFELTMTPTDFKVFLDGDTTGRPALLAAMDSQLDLAFLQLEEPPEEPLVAVDFSQAAEPRVGDEVMAVSRLNQSFDHAAYYETYRIAGEVTKPRRAWVLDGDLSALGLPVFDADGMPLGVVSTVVSTIAPEGAGRTGPSALAGALDQRKTLGPVGIFMLPARPVAKAVELSLGRARELLRERQEAVAEAPAGDGGG